MPFLNTVLDYGSKNKELHTQFIRPLSFHTFASIPLTRAQSHDMRECLQQVLRRRHPAVCPTRLKTMSVSAFWVWALSCPSQTMLSFVHIACMP
jgi:hypothetical protein